MKTIFKRRSIRKFKNEALQEEEISFLLKAAMAAPTANNLREWHFVVIDKRDLLDQLATVHPYARMLKTATAAIAVCGDTSVQPVSGYVAVDGAAATQNILLAATSLKIGSVWLGVYPREQRMKDIAQLLGLPDQIMPVSLIALGYPDEKKPANDNWFAEKIHFNKW
jgi:nitroreductase